MDLRQAQRQARVAEQRPVSPTPVTPQQQMAPVPKKGGSKLWKTVGAALLGLVLLGAVAYYAFGVGSPIDKSKYQAVFLTNGQVYFGKLSGWGGSNVALTDVYYFQAAGDTTGADAENPEESNANTQTLVKLGEEIHKPTDKLILNKDAVLFVENIEDDGQVVEAIKNNQDNKKD